MPAARISHLQFFVNPEHLPWYRNLLGSLGWGLMVDAHGLLGFQDAAGIPSLWFVSTDRAPGNDHDAPGLNHLALAADSVAAVDDAAAWLTGNGIAALFETPRHRPDFSQGEGHTYYQVMFETPDKLLIEVVYTGPHDAQGTI